MNDIVLCELDIEGTVGKVLFYIGRVLELEEDGHITVMYGRIKDQTRPIKDTFHFPNKEDVAMLVRSRVLGVLPTKAGKTARLADVVKVWPALNGFNIR